MDFNINPVQPDEVPDLLQMILELARFERLEHAVQATPESLHEALFAPRPAAGALLARHGSDPAGYAIYFFTFSSFVGRRGLWLDDVYVRPAFRAQGLGRALLRAVANIGVARQCGRFEWTALNWNQPALEFYRSLGAQSLNEWVLLRLDREGLRRLAQPADPAAALSRSAEKQAKSQATS